jgi:(S)-sulfolactate dehydrogenase
VSARIVITEFMDADAVEWLRTKADVLYEPDLVDHPDRLRAAAAGADALIVRNRTQVRGSLLEALNGGKAIDRLGVGLDNIDVEACRAKDIAVIPATGANATAVAEYVIACLLLLARPVYAASAEVVGGLWPRSRLIGGELAGRTLGLLGFGGIAREVARRASSFDMEVIAHDPLVPADDPAWQRVFAKPAGFSELLATADAVSLHVPLTEETRNMIDADALSAMKHGAFLINTSRGGVVDEPVLAAALHSGQIAGAALDVFAEEPLPAGSPLSDAPNLIATPHIAGVTHESNRRVSRLIAKRVMEYLEQAK